MPFFLAGPSTLYNIPAIYLYMKYLRMHGIFDTDPEDLGSETSLEHIRILMQEALRKSNCYKASSISEILKHIYISEQHTLVIDSQQAIVKLMGKSLNKILDYLRSISISNIKCIGLGIFLLETDNLDLTGFNINTQRTSTHDLGFYNAEYPHGLLRCKSSTLVLSDAELMCSGSVMMSSFNQLKSRNTRVKAERGYIMLEPYNDIKSYNGLDISATQLIISKNSTQKTLNKILDQLDLDPLNSPEKISSVLKTIKYNKDIIISIDFKEDFSSIPFRLSLQPISLGKTPSPYTRSGVTNNHTITHLSYPMIRARLANYYIIY